ncbi:MAG: DNA-processing protein DprA [Giesbergeria sp.]|jgi:DNA processing protein|nr:DNA-processing protein DprA [Giesbergeria sp.]
MEREELAAWLRLSLTPGVGNAAARRLLVAFGWPQRIFDQSAQALQACVTAAQTTSLLSTPDTLSALVETTWQWLQEGGVNGAPVRAIAPLGHPLYPAMLLDTDDPPLLLYLMGAPRFMVPGALADMRCLAMVGSRNPTPQGQDHAHQFARALRSAGLTIVSGLALGIDAAAHEGALAASTEEDPTPATLAVVGTGLDRVYPRHHLDLAHRIAAQGVLVSEYPLGTPPLAPNFPKRNRIISGLSQGTLVVEAAPASGSLITARLASEQGREVFAIPGSIHAIQSRGCHALIRQGAKLVESAQDVLEELQGPAATPSAIPSTDPPSGKTMSPLLDAMGFDPIGLDALQARSGLDTASLQVQLLELELEGLVGRLPGGLFQRIGLA